MNIQTELRDDHQARLTVEFDQETFEGYKRKAARKIASEAKIPGFRPGKAPYDVIRRMYGDGAIDQEAVELLIDALYPKILEEAKIEPGAPGALEDIASMDPLKLVFLIPLEPTVNLGEYRAIRLPYEPETISDEAVEKVMTRLHHNSGTAEPVERSAENGDLVAIVVDAHLTKPDEGQDEKIITGEHAELLVGDTEEQWPVPGFSNNLIGLAANDEKTITIIFPEDEENEALRGKDAEFHVKVESVKKMTLPEINDEWAQSMGEFQTVQDLRDDIRHRLEDMRVNEYNNEYFDKLLGLIAAGAEIKYPPQILDDEIEHMLGHLEHDLEHQHMDLDTYFKLMNTDRETFVTNEVRPTAIERIERNLVIQELGRAESITIQDGDMNEVTQEAISELQYIPGIESMRKISNDLRQQITMNAMSRVLQRRILQRIKAIATDELEKAEEPVAETPEEETK